MSDQQSAPSDGDSGGRTPFPSSKGHIKADDTHSEHSAKSSPTPTAIGEGIQDGDLEKQKAPEADPNEDTYLHGLKLVVVFIGLALALFVIILDQTILIPALPIIASDFDAIRQVGWISSQKWPLMAAIGTFELGSLIAAVSRNFVTLIVGRAVAGLGGAAIMVAIMSIAARIIELKRRPVFFGFFGLLFVLGSALGPIIGGTFTSKVTWRWCFWINLPIGGLSMLAVFFCIPTLEPPVRPAKPASKPLLVLRKIFGNRPSLETDKFVSRVVDLDWIATAITLCGVVSLTLALISGGSDGWSSHTVIIGFVCAGVALILLILWEVYVMKEEGMVPLRVAKFRGVWGAAGVSFMRMVSSLAIMSYLPTFMQATRHQSAIRSAISTLPYACGMAVFGMVGSVLVQKSGRIKWALILGSAISAVGGGLLYMAKADTIYGEIVGFQLICAIGSGLIMQNANLSAQAEMDANGLKADIPQASAVVMVIQLMGGSIGGSLGGALLANGLRNYIPSGISSETVSAILADINTIWTLSGATQTAVIDAYAKALDDVFLIGAAAGGLGVFFALLVRDINIKGKSFR